MINIINKYYFKILNIILEYCKNNILILLASALYSTYIALCLLDLLDVSDRLID